MSKLVPRETGSSVPTPPDEKVGEKNGETANLNVKEFLALAHTRFRIAADAESEWRKLGLEDLKFSIGEHWNPTEKTKRERKNRPCITLNHIGQSIKQVTNNQRQQRPAIQVNPAGDGSSKEVAEIFQGIVRHIEVQSEAEVAYDTAFDYMARMGKAPWRVITEYVDDEGESLDQEIFIKSVQNPFAFYGDPHAVEPDKSDRRFGFFVRDLSHDEYRSEYPNTALASLNNFDSIGNSLADWANKTSLRIAEYFYLKTEEVKGKKRTFTRKKIMWATINAIETIDGPREWAGKFIPVPEVVGDDLIVDGKRHTAGMVRDAKEPSRVYNYEVSAAVEVLSLAPKAPYGGLKGQFNDPKWEDANDEDYSYLEHEAVLLPDGTYYTQAPIRNAVETPIVAIAQMIKQADNDIKATTGIYDASLGQRGPDESGKAILQRKQQGDNATFNYTDNLARAIRFTGRILVDLIPKIYTVPRIQRIIKPDGQADHVGIWNSTHPDSKGMTSDTVMQMLAVKKLFDIGVGKYDVTISVGPSYQTKRQEASATMIELMKSVPIIQQAAPDLMVAQMDFPGSEVVAKRIKRALPQQLQDDGDDSPEAKLSQAQARVQELTQHNTVLMQEFSKAQDTINQKQIENNAKITIAKIDAFRAITVAEISTKAQSQNVRTQLESDELQSIHQGAHEVGQAAAEHARAQQLSAQGHNQNLEAADQSAGHAQDAAIQQAALNPPQPEGNQPSQ